MTAAFDTLKYAKQLKQAGVPEDQAEVHAEALRGVLEEQIMARFDRLDDRFDQVNDRFERVNQRLDRLDTDMQVLKADIGMVKWILGGLGFGVVLLLIRAFWPV